jgi:hypothetical protein
MATLNDLNELKTMYYNHYRRALVRYGIGTAEVQQAHRQYVRYLQAYYREAAKENLV